MRTFNHFYAGPKRRPMASFLKTFIENTLKSSLDTQPDLPCYTLFCIPGFAFMVEISNQDIGFMVCSKEVKMLFHRQKHYLYAPFYEPSILQNILPYPEGKVDGKLQIIETALAQYERLVKVNGKKDQEVRMIGETIVLLVSNVNVQRVQSVNKTLRDFPEMDVCVIIVVTNESPAHMEYHRIEKSIQTDAPLLTGYCIYNALTKDFTIKNVQSLDRLSFILSHLTSTTYEQIK